MKLLSLNIWGGKEFNPLIGFIKSQSKDIDIFCLQEVFAPEDESAKTGDYKSKFWPNLGKLINTYDSYFNPVMRDRDDNIEPCPGLLSGLGILVKKGLNIQSQGDIFIYREKFAPVDDEATDLPVNIQYIELDIAKKPLLICHIHGLWYPGDKLDTPERIVQSQRILQFLDKYQSAKIIAGDFNLLPETESLKMLEKKMKNLIKEFHIETTRSSLNPYFGTPGEQKFSDYVFVSKDIKVLDFQVPKVEVSDHLPMVLEFEV